MQPNLASNLWKYTLLLIANKRVYIAILGAYYLMIPGVTEVSIGLILLVGSVAGFLLEIPSGYLADTFGHKRTLVLSRILMTASTAFFLFATDLRLLILGSVFLSFAHAFQSGTGSAFMHETMRGLGREGEYAKVMGKITSIGFAVPIALTVAIPFLVDISFRLPFAIALIVDVIGLIVALVLVTPNVPQQEIEEVDPQNFRQVMREGYRLGFFGPALFLGLVSGVLFAVSSFRAPMQMFVGVPVIWFGVLFGIGRAGASALLWWSGWVRARTTMVSFFRWQLVVYGMLIVLLGLITNWWVVVTIFILINALQWGLSQVTNSYLLDIIRSSRYKATLLSAHSQIDQLIAAVFGFGLGLLIEQFSYHGGFLYLGILFVASATPVYLYTLWRHRTRVDGSDVAPIKD